MRPVIDPRNGDIEDDASSTKRRSLLSLLGSLLAEVSLPKLVSAWISLFVVPGLLLGLAPIAISAWLRMVAAKIISPPDAIWPMMLLVLALASGWFGGRRLLRLAESSFWSLQALAVQPSYTVCREGLRHLAELFLSSRASTAQFAALRGITAVASGLVVCGLAVLALMLAWPSSRWTGNVSDLASPHSLAVVALANSLVLISAYFAAAALVWFKDGDVHDGHVHGDGVEAAVLVVKH